MTDSLLQHRVALSIGARGRQASKGMFLQSIGMNAGPKGENAVLIDAPSRFVTCADAGWMSDDFVTGTLAYPDLCRLECADSTGMVADWERCPWSRQCGATAEMKHSVEARRPYARHNGGVNIGFLDGHAAWFASEEVIRESPSSSNPTRGRLRGFTSGADW